MLANSYLTSDHRAHANVFVIGPYSSLKFVPFIKVLMFSYSKTCHDPGTKNGYTNPVTILTKDSALDSVRSWSVFSLLGIYCTQIRPSEFDNIAISGHSGVISRDVTLVLIG